MKRFFAAALVLSLFSTCTLVGCSDESSTTTKETVKSPEGSTTTTKKETVESTGGDKAPANSTGETGKTAETPK